MKVAPVLFTSLTTLLLFMVMFPSRRFKLKINETHLGLDEVYPEDELEALEKKTQPSIKLSGCLNDVYVEHKTGLFTMLVDTTGGPYTTGAVKLLERARQFTKVPFSSVLVELKEKPLPPVSRRKVIDAGWTVCTVNGITVAGLSGHYADQFSKFVLWNMVEMDTIVYLDSDTYIFGDITSLFKLQLPPEKKIAAAPDSMIQRNPFFNMGVFVFHPNKPHYELLMSYMRGEKTISYNPQFAEQAFLNELWKGDWHPLDLKYNTLVHEMHMFPKAWARRYRGHFFRSSLIHFTIPKPWRCTYEVPQKLREACVWWLEDLTPVELSRCSVPTMVIGSEVTVWTSINNGTEVDAAVDTLRRIKQETKTPFSSVVMLAEKGGSLSAEGKKELENAGWTLCMLEDVEEKVELLWGMTELGTIVYFDLKTADHGTARRVGQLLPTRLPKTAKVGAMGTGDGESFDASLLVIHPSEEDHKRLRSHKEMLLKEKGGQKPGVQGFLNSAWKNEWHRIPALPSSEVEQGSNAEVTLSLCTNGVRVGKKIAVFSRLDDFDGTESMAVEAAVKQLRSAKNHSKVEFASVLLEMEGKPIAKQGREKLESAGWKVCTLNITNPQFAISALWGMVGLDTVLYLSPRTFVVGDISDLLVTRLRPSRKVGATLDKGESSLRFSSRVLLLHPAEADYAAFSAQFASHGADAMSATFSQGVHDLGMKYGADVRYIKVPRKRNQPSVWLSVKPDIRIVDYAGIAPWACRGGFSDEMREVCGWWKR